MEQGSSSGPPAHNGGEREPGLDRDVAEGELVEDAERLTPYILAQIQQHLHLPIQVPDADKLAELRQKDPAAHKMWLKQVNKQLDHQRFMESARYRMPMATIRGAQIAALIALMMLTGLAGYMAYLDHTWLAGLFGAFDVLGILTLFLAPRSDSDGDD